MLREVSRNATDEPETMMGQEAESEEDARPQISWRAGCRESGTSGSEGDSCKSAVYGNSVAVYPTP